MECYIKIQLFDYIDRIQFIPETDPYILKILSEDGNTSDSQAEANHRSFPK